MSLIYFIKITFGKRYGWKTKQCYNYKSIFSQILRLRFCGFKFFIANLENRKTQGKATPLKNQPKTAKLQNLQKTHFRNQFFQTTNPAKNTKPTISKVLPNGGFGNKKNAKQQNRTSQVLWLCGFPWLKKLEINKYCGFPAEKNQNLTKHWFRQVLQFWREKTSNT